VDSRAIQTFGILKDAIFSGMFKPGEALREMHLAKMLDVSQATVREALVRLERLGLVVREQNRRTTVTSFTINEVKDRLHMRIVLEELAAVLASARMSGEDIVRLSDLAREIQQAIDSGGHPELVLADFAFHQFIWQKAETQILFKTLEQITTPLFAFQGVLHKAGLTDIKSTKPHERIVEAIGSRDEERIRAEIRDHIEGSYGVFLNSGVPALDGLLSAKPE
jgi:DNA-binding GntR family transcriptional regulator